MKAIRIALLTYGAIAAFFFALSTGGSLYLRTEHARRFLQGRLDSLFPGSVEWSELRVHPFRGEIDIFDARVKGPSGEQLAAVGRIHARLSLGGFFKKEIRFTRLVIENPRVLLRSDGSESFTIVDAFVPAGTGEETERDGVPFTLAADHFTISNGNIRFVTADGFVSLDAEGVQIDGSGDTAVMVLETDLEAKRVSLAVPAGSAELGAVTAKSTLRAGRADIGLFTARSGRSKVTASGTVSRPFAAPDMNVSLEAVLDSRDFPGFCFPGPEFSGEFHATMKARGKPADPELNLALECGGGFLFGARFDTMKLELDLKDRLVNLKKAEGSVYGGRFTFGGAVDLRDVFPAGFASSDINPDRVSYRFQAEGRDLDLETMPGAAGRAGGTVRALLSVEGEGASTRRARAKGAADVSVRGFSTPFTVRRTDVQARADFRFNEGTLTFTERNRSSEGEDISTEGSVDAATGYFVARARVEVPDAGPVFGVFGIEGLSGGGALDAFAHGDIRKPEVSVIFGGEDLSFRDVRIGDVHVEGRLDETGTLRVEGMTVKNGTSIIEGSGSIGVFGNPSDSGETEHPSAANNPIHAALDFHDLRIDDFTPQESFSGFFDGSMRLGGSMQNPRVDIVAEARALTVEGFALGTCRFDLGYEGGIVHVRNASMEKGGSQARVRGEVFLPEGGTPWRDSPVQDAPGEVKPEGTSPGRLSSPIQALARNGLESLQVAIDVESDALSLEDFKEDMSGTLSLSARVEGPLARPSGEILVSGKNLDLGVQKLGEVHVDAKLSNEGVSIDPFEVTIADGEYLRGTGFIGYSKLFRFELDSSRVSLVDLDVLKGLEGLEGRVRIALSGSGSIDDPTMRGDIALENLAVGDNLLGGFDCRLYVGGGKALLVGESTLPARRVSPKASTQSVWPYSPPAASKIGLSGVYSIGDGSYSANLSLLSVDLKPWFTIGGADRIDGNVSGTVELTGHAGAHGASISGSGLLSSLKVLSGGKNLVSARDLALSYADKVLYIQGQGMRVLEGGLVDLNGALSTSGSLQSLLTGRLPFSAAGLLVPDLENAEGTVYVDARLGGTFGSPELEGSVTLKDVGFTLPVLSQRVHGLNGRLDVTPKRISMRSVEGKLDSGRFTLSGAVDVEGTTLGRASFELNADALPIQIPDTAQLLVSARLKIEGTPGKSTAKGEVSLLDGLYYRDFRLNLLQDEPPTKGGGTLAPIDIPIPYLRNMTLDVSLTRRNPLVVDNNIASLNINPDLHVTGKLNSPIITGRAVVESGTIDYGDRTFTVRKGLIDFLSPYKIDPSFDIVGDTQIRDWLITLQITGKPENLDFTLSSDPMIEDADILSLLVTGKTASEFIKKEANPTQSAATMLTDIITSSIGKDIKKVTGLDVLETQAEIGDVPASPENGSKMKTGLEWVKITIGKELTRRLKIEYSAEFNADGFTQRAEADYLVLANTYLKGFQDSVGRFGGALQYRLEFR